MRPPGDPDAPPDGDPSKQPPSATVTRQAIIDAYRKYLGRDPSDDEVMQWVNTTGGDPAVVKAISESDEAKSYAKAHPSTTTTAEPPPTTGGGDPTSAINLNAPLVKKYDVPFTPPSMLDLGGPAGLSYIPNAPRFQFNAPSIADALNEPGYQFGVQQGDAGIQNWAASRGMLNDPTTARSLSDYNRSAAQQDYSSVWNRSFQSQSAEFAPLMASWSTMAAAGQHQNDLNYSNAWNQWLAQLNDYNNWQDRTFNKLSTNASA